jgi:glyoxylase-like metal-dependent hydrolase (beta-lactamase superfamily II)
LGEEALVKLHTIKIGNTNCFLLQGTGGSVLIDSGTPRNARKLLDAMNSLGLEPGDLKLIVLTHGHFDHFGSALELKRATGANVAIQRRDRFLVAHGIVQIPPAQTLRGQLLRIVFLALSWQMRLEPFEPDLALQEGDSLERFGVEAIVLETPGHSKGSISVHVPSLRAVFVGDLLINRDLLSEPVFAEDREALRASIGRIRKLAPWDIYPAHGDRVEYKQLNEILPGRYQLWWWLP